MAVVFGEIRRNAYQPGRAPVDTISSFMAKLFGDDLKVPTTLLRIEPHRLQELVREDLRRYPRSKIGEISSRIGQEVNRSQLKRALAELVGLSVVVMEGERSGARYRLAGEK